MDISITVALTIVASVGTVCLTLYQIFSTGKKDKEPKEEDKTQVLECIKRFETLETNVAVSTTKIDLLQKSVDKLTEITYDTLVHLATEHEKDDKNGK
jgi:flagellar basal body-associated protein FliL